MVMAKPFRRRIFNAVGLNGGAPVATREVQLEGLRDKVTGLLGASEEHG